MLRTFAATTIVALTLTAAHARAESTEASIVVPFGDLNLTLPRDARIMAVRLQTAARQVCLPVATGDKYLADPAARQTMQACMNTAIDLAMARIKSKLDSAVRVYLVASNDKP
ncbi:MAG: UrcA family protein [Rhizomicrobium sp.]